MSETKAPSGYAVEQAMSAWQAARQRLLVEDPALEQDEAALIELLGPEEATLQDILARLLRGALHARDMAAAADARLKAMKGRQDRYKARAEFMQTAAFGIMQATGERRFELPDLLATVRRGPKSVFILDEAALPDVFVHEVTTRTPDKKLIAAALKQQDEIREALIAEAEREGRPVDETALPSGIPGAMWANGADFLTLKGS